MIVLHTNDKQRDRYLKAALKAKMNLQDFIHSATESKCRELLDEKQLLTSEAQENTHEKSKPHKKDE